MSNLPSRVEVAPNVLFQELDGESVLLNLDNDRYYGLDDIGTKIWRLLARDGDVAAVVRQLLADHAGEVDEPTLRRDLHELIDRLAHAGLIKVAGDGDQR